MLCFGQTYFPGVTPEREAPPQGRPPASVKRRRVDKHTEACAGEGEQCLLGHGVDRVGAEDSTAER
jgi:hypothetical protein